MAPHALKILSVAVFQLVSDVSSDVIDVSKFVSDVSTLVKAVSASFKAIEKIINKYHIKHADL